jgi:hypothetical protein
VCVFGTLGYAYKLLLRSFINRYLKIDQEQIIMPCIVPC